MCSSYIWGWYDLQCSTESLESPSGTDCRSPPPVPSPWTQTRPSPCVLLLFKKQSRLEQTRLCVPLGKSFAGGIKHATGGSMKEAHFAAQHLHRVTLLTPAHLHLPQVIGISCAVLRRGKRQKCVLSLCTNHVANGSENLLNLKYSCVFQFYSQCHSL